MSLKTRLIAPYQHDGVRWMVKRERDTEHPGGFLCDEMGLGKTVQLLATMCINSKDRTLVIVPKSIVGQWASEVKRFTPHIETHTFAGAKRVAPEFTEGTPKIVVASYSMVRDGTLQSFKWDRIILDEAHEVRNSKSKTYKDIMRIQGSIKWIVTGTPVFNSVKDFVTLGTVLGLTVSANITGTRERYVLRRTKDDLNARLKLPPCDFENLEIEMTPEEHELYTDVFFTAQDAVRDIMKSSNAGMYQMEILECLLRARQVMTWPQMYLDGIAKKEKTEADTWCGKSAKLDKLIELLDTHVSEKSLVFCQFMGEMDRIQSMLTELGFKVFRIDGSVDKDGRESRIKEFKDTPRSAVFLIQIKAGGVGLNLQEATRVYITAPSWNPATELQAIARAHRTGQTQKVVVRKLVYAGTEKVPSVEQSIMQLQNHKAAVCADVLNDPKLAVQIPPTKSKLSVRTIAKLFSV